MEVVVSSECSGQLWNTCIWEPLTGTTLRTFKGGISGSQSLNIVGGDYLLSSLKDKPIIQVCMIFMIVNAPYINCLLNSGLGVEQARSDHNQNDHARHYSSVSDVTLQ